MMIAFPRLLNNKLDYVVNKEKAAAAVENHILFMICLLSYSWTRLEHDFTLWIFCLLAAHEDKCTAKQKKIIFQARNNDLISSSHSQISSLKIWILSKNNIF